MKSDTIVAIASGMTQAGISIIRMSGSEAIRIIDDVFIAKNGIKIKDSKTYTIHYGFLKEKDEIIDEVIVLYMKGPNSYTREDVIEIDCHGGILITRKVLDTLILHGARPAEPGEFTKRAFLNGRIDLSEAEAVIDIIESQNEFALKSSVSQLKGSVNKKIKEMREKIIYEIAFIESALDDPEHISIEGYAQKLAVKTDELLNETKKLLDTADDGKMLKEGIRTVILGKPNAGKSSLLNVMVGENRAIVTEIAGTTRDILEESIIINGIQLNIIDTAGIRKTEDVVEKIGVEKAFEYAKEADLIVYVVDSSTNFDINDEKILEFIRGKKVIVLLNKSDLDSVVSIDEIKEKIDAPIIAISAINETGIDNFTDELKNMFFHGDISINNEVYITSARHKSELAEVYESLRLVQTSIEDQMPEDFYSIDLMRAYECLGNIIGESVEDDLVDEIFHKFCMGK